MKRRDFITLLGGAASWPLAAGAQQPGKLPTVGFLGAASASAWSQWVAAFLQRLHELGWIEGRNLTIEYNAGGRQADGSRSSVVMSSAVDSGRASGHGNINANDRPFRSSATNFAVMPNKTIVQLSLSENLIRRIANCYARREYDPKGLRSARPAGLLGHVCFTAR